MFFSSRKKLVDSASEPKVEDHSEATETTEQAAEIANKMHQKTRSYDSGLFAKIKGLLGWQSLDVTENHKALEDNFDKDQKQSLWQMASSLIGTDPVSLISLPVWLFEPTTFLTRMAEPMFFADAFFSKAANTDDPIEQLAQIAAFNVAVLCFTQRNLKPFNPVLGETFEFVNDKVQFISEQVSHHPPISAGETRALSGDWICQQEVNVKTKLWGNYVEIFPIGNTHVYLPKKGHHFYWPQPNLCLHNIIVGGMWYDYYGTIEIVNENGNGEKATVTFHRCGLFSRGSYRKVTGEIKDKDGNVRMTLRGYWNKYFKATRIYEDGKKGDEYSLWEKNKELLDYTGDKWRIPKFVWQHQLTLPDPSILPPTDSRLRSDLRALTEGAVDRAGKEKMSIEKLQRQKRAERQKSGIEWTPMYFAKIGDGEKSCAYQYVGKYWEDREERIKKKAESDTSLPNLANAVEALSVSDK